MQEETSEAVGVPARVLPFVQVESRHQVTEARIVDEGVPLEPVAPVVVLGDKVAHTKLRGGLAVLETESGVTVLLDARAARLACIALGIALQR